MYPVAENPEAQWAEIYSGTEMVVDMEAHQNHDLDDEHVIQHTADSHGKLNNESEIGGGLTQEDDLMYRIPGLYRLFQLINDGSCKCIIGNFADTDKESLADKAIIHQDSICQLTNSAVPGSYSSISKVLKEYMYLRPLSKFVLDQFQGS
jgi:hypothetical protein